MLQLQYIQAYHVWQLRKFSMELGAFPFLEGCRNQSRMGISSGAWPLHPKLWVLYMGNCRKTHLAFHLVEFRTIRKFYLERYLSCYHVCKMILFKISKTYCIFEDLVLNQNYFSASVVLLLVSYCQISVWFKKLLKVWQYGRYVLGASKII